MASTVGTTGGQIIARTLFPRHNFFALFRQAQVNVPETTGKATVEGSSGLFYSAAVLMSLLGFGVSAFSITQLQNTAPPKTMIALMRNKHD